MSSGTLAIGSQVAHPVLPHVRVVAQASARVLGHELGGRHGPLVALGDVDGPRVGRRRRGRAARVELRLGVIRQVALLLRGRVLRRGRGSLIRAVDHHGVVAFLHLILTVLPATFFVGNRVLGLARLTCNLHATVALPVPACGHGFNDHTRARSRGPVGRRRIAGRREADQGGDFFMIAPAQRRPMTQRASTSPRSRSAQCGAIN